MITGINAKDKFYYCPSCKKFHEIDSAEHRPVNRKLCFYCGKNQSQKTKIIGDDNEGRSQICSACYQTMKFYI